MKPKVLYIGGFEMPDKNAAAHRVFANAMTLKELGYDVSFIGPTKDLFNINKEFGGFKCEFIKYPKTLWQWFRYITSFIPIKRILEYKPDFVILYNFPSIAALKILKISRNNDFKVFYDITEWESIQGWTPRKLIRRVDINLRMRHCIKKIDGAIVISRFLYDYCSNYTNTILVPPTVNLKDPKFRRNRNLTVNNPIQLVYAGSIGTGEKEKLDNIVNNVSKIKSFKLTVVGLTVEEYENIYGNLPENCNNVVFKGRISHKDAVSIVCKSDFQMLIREDTLKNKAGFPTKFVESISCCTPVIATNFSDICDYLVDEINGFLVGHNCSLMDVLIKISHMDNADILKMKKRCCLIVDFDYRYYKEKFSKLFRYDE